LGRAIRICEAAMRKNIGGKSMDAEFLRKPKDDRGIGSRTNPSRRTARIWNSGSAGH